MPQHVPQTLRAYLSETQITNIYIIYILCINLEALPAYKTRQVDTAS